MKALPLFFFVFLAKLGLAQSVIFIDAGTMRTQIGYANFNLKLDAAAPNRIAHMLDMQLEVRAFSHATENNLNFFIQDALFFQFGIGYMSSEPLMDGSTESRMSIYGRFGYSFMPAYQTDKFGVGFGIRPQWTMGMIGDSFYGEEIANFTAPLQAMFVWPWGNYVDFSLVVTGWSNFSNNKNDSGVRVDIPLHPHKSSKIYLLLGMQQIHGGQPGGHSLRQLAIGYRSGFLY
jgi:hypothetical protein